MKFISVFLVLVTIMNVTSAKKLLDIFLENRNIHRDLTKAPKPPLHVFQRTGKIGVFPRLPSRKLTFVVDSPIENSSQATQPKQYDKPSNQKVPIKDINHKENVKRKPEVTTRRPLMPMKKFTVRPHDIYPESHRDNYNWYSNRKNIHKSSIPEKQFKQNRFVAAGSRISKTIVPFLKRKNTKYSKESPESSLKRSRINNFVSDSDIPLKANNRNGRIIGKKVNTTVPTIAVIKSNSKDQIDEMVEPRNLFDPDELISVKKEKSFVVPDIADHEEMTTDSDIEYSVSRPKRSVNIIEEESVATTFSGIKITHQDYPSHDLILKNIHT